jgi:hypothetical protein
MSYSFKYMSPSPTDSDNGRTGYREARLTAWSVRVPPSLEFASPRVLLSSVLSLSICFWRAESTLGFIFLSACLFEISLPYRYLPDPRGYIHWSALRSTRRQRCYCIGVGIGSQGMWPPLDHINRLAFAPVSMEILLR